MQEIETSVGNMNRDAFMPDNMENGCDVKDLTFPDAHALLHVTDRRKIHSKTTGSFRVLMCFYIAYFDVMIWQLISYIISVRQ